MLHEIRISRRLETRQEQSRTSPLFLYPTSCPSPGLINPSRSLTIQSQSLSHGLTCGVAPISPIRLESDVSNAAPQ